jgi:hypothetical protein
MLSAPNDGGHVATILFAPFGLGLAYVGLWGSFDSSDKVFGESLEARLQNFRWSLGTLNSQDCLRCVGILFYYVQKLGTRGDPLYNLLILLWFLGVTLLPNHR